MKTYNVKSIKSRLAATFIILSVALLIYIQYNRDPDGPRDLQITRIQWKQGSLIKSSIRWGLIVKNASDDKSYKDLKFRCDYFTESGKKISSEKHTAYIVVDKSSEKKVTINQSIPFSGAEQLNHAKIKIISAKSM